MGQCSGKPQNNSFSFCIPVRNCWIGNNSSSSTGGKDRSLVLVHDESQIFQLLEGLEGEEQEFKEEQRSNSATAATDDSPDSNSSISPSDTETDTETSTSTTVEELVPKTIAQVKQQRQEETVEEALAGVTPETTTAAQITRVELEREVETDAEPAVAETIDGNFEEETKTVPETQPEVIETTTKATHRETKEVEVEVEPEIETVQVTPKIAIALAIDQVEKPEPETKPKEESDYSDIETEPVSTTSATERPQVTEIEIGVQETQVATTLIEKETEETEKADAQPEHDINIETLATLEPEIEPQAREEAVLSSSKVSEAEVTIETIEVETAEVELDLETITQFESQFEVTELAQASSSLEEHLSKDHTADTNTNTNTNPTTDQELHTDEDEDEDDIHNNNIDTFNYYPTTTLEEHLNYHQRQEEEEPPPQPHLNTKTAYSPAFIVVLMMLQFSYVHALYLPSISTSASTSTILRNSPFFVGTSISTTVSLTSRHWSNNKIRRLQNNIHFQYWNQQPTFGTTTTMLQRSKSSDETSEDPIPSCTITSTSLPSSSSGVVRVLCLHGKGGYGHQFQKKLEPLERALQRQTSEGNGPNLVRFDYLTAPFSMEDRSLKRQWWELPPNTRSFTADEYIGFDTTAEYVTDALLKREQPKTTTVPYYDVIIGHSQGSIAVASLLARGMIFKGTSSTTTTATTTTATKVSMPRIGFILNGCAWPNPFKEELTNLIYHHNNNDDKDEIDPSSAPSTPRVLFVIGNNDTINPPEGAERVRDSLRSAGFDVETCYHEGGHSIPVDDDEDALEYMVDWILRGTHNF